MRPNKYLHYLPLFLLIFCCHLPAYAGFKFGDNENIRFIANITLQGANGERLFLARKLEEHHFVLPYGIEDRGYVLGISGESHRYYPMPDEAKLKELQDAGYLPRPLPPFELDNVDWVFGHLLWFVLAGLLCYAVFLHLKSKYFGKSAS